MTARLSPQREAEIRERCEAATPGPWVEHTDYGKDFYAYTGGSYLRGVGTLNFGDGEDAEADREFTLNASADVATLLAELAAVRAELAEVVTEIARFGIYGSAISAAKALVTRASELVNENASLRTERPADAVHYGIRLPDGAVLDGTVTDLAEQQARLERYRDLYPDAVLVQRDVHHGPWAEVTS